MTIIKQLPVPAEVLGKILSENLKLAMAAKRRAQKTARK